MANDILLQEVYEAFYTIPGVSDVVSLHIWTIAEQRRALTARMSADNLLVSDYVAAQARRIAADQGIRYTSLHIDAQPCRTIWQTIKGKGFE